MNFRTASLDFPQKEQRRCLSCDMAIRYGTPGRGSPGRGTAGTGGGSREEDRATHRVNRSEWAGSSEMAAEGMAEGAFRMAAPAETA